MNNGYLNNNNFSNLPLYSNGMQVPNQSTAPKNNYQEYIPDEQSYIENILRLNSGKKAKLHVTVPGSTLWQDRVFEGIIEQSGRDHVIMSNPNTGEWYLVLMIYLDFVTVDEPINFIKDFS